MQTRWLLRGTKIRILKATSLALFCCLAWADVPAGRAEDLFLADGKAFPGVVWRSDAGTREREVFRFSPRPSVAARNHVPKIGSVAVMNDGKQYFCSGLDGTIFHNLGGHDVVSYQHEGQIRDLATSQEEHVIYFSSVATPQNNAPLANGTIYRYDLYDGQARAVLTVRQEQVGNNWWGTFAVHDGNFYLASLGSPARIYKAQGTEVDLLHESPDYQISGFSMGADGEFFFANGTNKVFRTRDFSTVNIALQSERRFTDICLPAGNSAAGP